MGYYSSLALDFLNYDYDRSYPSPEEQLLWRLDDLHDRLEELTASGTPYMEGTRLTEDDIRYALPECFEKITDVEFAIEVAINDLKCQYGIDVEAVTDGQLSLFEIIPLQPCGEPLKVA